MNLTTEYRPNSLEEVIGNNKAVTVIKKNLKSKTIPHTYMITGPTGSGKTTLARILANLLGAHENDIIEYQLRSIEETRDLREDLNSAPMYGKAKVYIIDELQHLTKDGQNDLLKPLEDTPKHVYFILCTTDPQKIIDTVKGRCIKIKTEPLCETDAYLLLSKLTQNEKQPLDNSIAKLIINKAEGLPRNIITAFASVRGIDNVEDVSKILESYDLNDSAELIDLARNIVYSTLNWIDISNKLKTLTIEPESIRIMLANYMKAGLLSNIPPKSTMFAKLLEYFINPFYAQQTAHASLTLACYKAFYTRVTNK